MKILQLFLLASSLLPIGLNAQQQRKLSNWHVGLQGGVGIGNMANSNIFYQLVDQPSLVVGGQIGYNLGRNFSVQLEADFERRIFTANRFISGLRLTDTSSYVCWQCYYDYSVEFISDYLSFPLLIVYSKVQKKLSFGVQAGVYYSLLLVNSREGYETYYLDAVGAAPFLPEYEPGTFTTLYSGTSNGIINTYDAGLLLGLTAKYALDAQWRITAEARVVNGFAGIYENPQMPLVNYKGFTLKTGVQYLLTK